MKCRDIIEILEQEVPLYAAEGWDNPGFLIGDRTQEVKKILVVLDITNEVVEKAIEIGADFILAHHPIIFSSMKRCTDENFIQKKMLQLIHHQISCYGMHTNYDVCRMGEQIAKRLSFCPQEALELTKNPKLREEGKGIGMIGNLTKPVTLEAYGQKIKKAFSLDSITIFGDLEHKVQKLAFVPGSGRSMIYEAVKKQADVLITGDIGHHEGLDAIDMGLSIIDAGHYGLEQIFIDDMSQLLSDKLPECEIISYKAGVPYKVI